MSVFQYSKIFGALVLRPASITFQSFSLTMPLANSRPTSYNIYQKGFLFSPPSSIPTSTTHLFPQAQQRPLGPATLGGQSPHLLRLATGLYRQYYKAPLAIYFPLVPFAFLFSSPTLFSSSTPTLSNTPLPERSPRSFSNSRSITYHGQVDNSKGRKLPAPAAQGPSQPAESRYRRKLRRPQA